jgi:hypothetical protein
MSFQLSREQFRIPLRQFLFEKEEINVNLEINNKNKIR